MKLLNLNMKGISTAKAHTLIAKNGCKYYAVTHGESGRGRWQCKLPLAAREFPYDENQPTISLDGDSFRLINLNKKDPRGNSLFLIGKGQPDNKSLVLWSLDPGYRGSASYNVAGNATVIAEGEEAQGTAGRMGGAFCPIVLVNGPCRLEWHRSGRLYDTPADFVAEFDGELWQVNTPEECSLESAIFDY
jgi:hypothetical protein